MRYLATFFAIAILAAGYASAQTTTNGALKLSSIVVTNEQDLVALAALAGKVGTNETRHVVLNTMEVMNGIRTAGNVLSVSPGTRELYDSDGRISIDWTGRVLTDGSFVQSIDWENRSLTDHHQLGSIRWDSRELAYDNYEVALDWGTSNQFKVGGALLVNGTNIITELNLKASSADMAGKYDASNPANYVDAVAVSNAIASSMSGNLIVQLTTNKTTSYTFEPTNATYIGQCAETALPAAGTVSVPIGAAGAYPLAWGCTNSTFTSIEGTYINGQLFCAENEAGDITAKVEIYRRDIVTDVMSEWGDGGATFTVPAGATPQVVPYSVWVPSVYTNSFRVWARVKRVGGSATSARLLIVGSGSGTPSHFSMTVPATVPISSHNADATAHPALKAYRAPFTTYTDLTGSITLTNNLEAPISISGTGSISVAFSGLVVPYPVYFTAQGFSSITFPAGSYLVGGGMWQTNRVNHFIVWKHSTNLFINPLLSTEIPE